MLILLSGLEQPEMLGRSAVILKQNKRVPTSQHGRAMKDPTGPAAWRCARVPLSARNQAGRFKLQSRPTVLSRYTCPSGLPFGVREAPRETWIFLASASPHSAHLCQLSISVQSPPASTASLPLLVFPHHHRPRSRVPSMFWVLPAAHNGLVATTPVCGTKVAPKINLCRPGLPPLAAGLFVVHAPRTKRS